MLYLLLLSIKSSKRDVHLPHTHTIPPPKKKTKKIMVQLAVTDKIRAGGTGTAVRPCPYQCDKRRFLGIVYKCQNRGENMTQHEFCIFDLLSWFNSCDSWQVLILLQDYFHVRKHSEYRNLKIAAIFFFLGWTPEGSATPPLPTCL